MPEMEIRFDKEYLRELYYEGRTSDRQHRYQPQVVEKYVHVINLLEAIDRVSDLYRFKALRYEKPQSGKGGFESVRVDDQYRIEFKSSEDIEKRITICKIIELSEYYKEMYYG